MSIATSIAIRIPRLRSSSTLSPNNIPLIQSWIKDCEATHVQCPNDSNVCLPTRVIDVSTPMPILAEFTDKKGRYTTLTYCWGISQENTLEDQYVTKSETLKSRMQGMPLDEMPQTFQDAVVATRILGIQYLWIDALCIIQDDLEDKKKEIPKMTSIYKNATVTLSAIQAANSRTGFLSRDSLPPPTVIMPYLSSQTSLSYYYMYAVRDEKIKSQITNQWKYDVDTSQWNTRAWTFQERLISRRILHFTNKALFFECHTSDISENDKSHLATTMPTNPSRFDREIGTLERLPDPLLVDKRKLFDTYYNLVTQYSRRLLSYQDDREDAFSAVIARFKVVLPFQYAAGIWMCDITQAHIDFPNLQVTWLFGKANRPQLQSFPSSDQKPSYEPPGDGTPAKLHVPAVMVDIDNYIINPRRLSNSRGVRIELQGQTFGYGDLDDYSIEPTSMIICCIGKKVEYVEYKGLAIGGLLVEPVDGELNCFRRIGFFESSGQPEWQLNMQDTDVEYEELGDAATSLARKHYDRFSDLIFGRPVGFVTLV
ncbi:hypothetical protein LCER1_G002847 [Lachnellula cervina]|uniref:Heterokaryon incompatibility domain-containing protein n=1 Tax=Lachnellula cervina TaxID=1316786 RepID=A0A7D8UTL7_9HELO|nr:hypothetical protein LCER1_G002847 [Lachnellula cervina]